MGYRSDVYNLILSFSKGVSGKLAKRPFFFPNKRLDDTFQDNLCPCRHHQINRLTPYHLQRAALQSADDTQLVFFVRPDRQCPDGPCGMIADGNGDFEGFVERFHL